MNDEEKELINNIERALNLSEVKGDLVTIIYNYIVKATINLINKLQKELEQEKGKNKKLNLENQALLENINFNDDNMLSRMYKNLKKDYHKTRLELTMLQIYKMDIKYEISNKLNDLIIKLEEANFGGFADEVKDIKNDLLEE